MDHRHPHPHPHPSLMSCVGEDHGLSSCSHCHGWGPKLSSSSSSSSSPSCHQLWDLVWVLLSVKEERASQDWITDMDRPTSVGFSQRYFWIFNVFFLTFHVFVLYSCTVRVDNRYGLAKECGEAKNTFVFCIIPAPNLGPLFIDEILPNPPTPPISMVCVSSRSWIVQGKWCLEHFDQKLGKKGKTPILVGIKSKLFPITDMDWPRKAK